MSNFDINVDIRTDGRTEKRTPISHPATSRCDKNIYCTLMPWNIIFSPHLWNGWPGGCPVPSVVPAGTTKEIIFIIMEMLI